MNDGLLEAFAEGLRTLEPFSQMPAMTRPADMIWEASNVTNLALRQPLYHQRLGKPRPKDKVFDTAIQHGLTLLAAFARAAGTRQIIVRLQDGERDAISMQPRPFGANWVREHGVSPASLWNNNTDPLPCPDPELPAHGQAAELSTRGVMHMAGKVALALQRRHSATPMSGTVTFVFQEEYPLVARAVFRPLEANQPQRQWAVLPKVD